MQGFLKPILGASKDPGEMLLPWHLPTHAERRAGGRAGRAGLTQGKLKVGSGVLGSSWWRAHILGGPLGKAWEGRGAVRS